MDSVALNENKFTLEDLIFDEMEKSKQSSVNISSPLGWVGGKFRIAKWIISMMPKHQCYVEPFFGAGHVFFNKPKAEVEVINDFDDRVYALFKVMSDKNLFKEFVEKVWFLGSHSKIYDEMQAVLNDKNASLVDKAVAFFYVNKHSLAGNLGNTFVSSPGSNMGGRFTSTKFGLLRIHERLSNAQVFCGDWKDVVLRHDSENTLVFLDPPYVEETRESSMGVYTNELSNDDHNVLVDTCLSLKSKVMLSGYANSIYKRLEESGWYRVDKKTVMSCARVKKSDGSMDRVESVWMNFAPKGVRETLV
jgi:DNA adenine methylase